MSYVNKDNLTEYTEKLVTMLVAVNDSKYGSKVFATPQEYGAVGDGVHDDTAAINQCLEENAVVFVPDGRYRVTATIATCARRRNFVVCSTQAMFIADRYAFNSAIEAAETVADRPSLLRLSFYIGWNDYGPCWIGGVINCNEVSGLIGVKVVKYAGSFAYVDNIFITSIGDNGIGLYMNSETSKIRFGRVSISASTLIYNTEDPTDPAWGNQKNLMDNTIGWYNDHSYDYSIGCLDINNCTIGIYSDGGTEIQCDNFHNWMGAYSTQPIPYSQWLKTRCYQGSGMWHFDTAWIDEVRIGFECSAVSADNVHVGCTPLANVSGAGDNPIVSYLIKPTSNYGSAVFKNLTIFENTSKFGGVLLDGTINETALFRRNIVRAELMYGGNYTRLGMSVIGNFARHHRTIMFGGLTANTKYVLGYLPKNTPQKIKLIFSSDTTMFGGECDILCRTATWVTIRNAKLFQSAGTRTWRIGVGSVVTTSEGIEYRPVVLYTDTNYSSANNFTIEVPEGLCIIAPEDEETYSGAMLTEELFTT